MNLGPVRAVQRVLRSLRVPRDVRVAHAAHRIVAQLLVLDQSLHHVDAKTVGAALEPEPDHAVNRRDHFRISIIQVGLLLEEHVQVPRRRRRVVLPRAAAEVALPVGRRTLRRAGNPDVPVAFRIGARRPRLDEPRMLLRSVIRHQIDNHANPAAMRRRDQPIERRQIAELRMDAAVVADVVAPVVERRRVDRVQPDRVDADRLEIVEMRGDAVEVADAVAVRIGERARIDLVEDGASPPIYRVLRKPRRWIPPQILPQHPV